MTQRPPRLGLGLTGKSISIADIADLAMETEQAGLDSFWHGENQREPWVPLAAAAVRTERVRLGTGVALWGRGVIPTDLAAVNMDELSQGRFVLGLGTGSRERNQAWYGLPYDSPVERMREFIELLRAMWSVKREGVLDHAGTHLSLRGYQRVASPGRERLPIFLGGRSKAMLELAGEVADGVLLDVFTTPLEMARRSLQHIHAGMRRAARARTELEIGSMVLAAVSRDPVQARNWARGQVAYYLRGAHADPVIRLHGFERQAKLVRAAAAAGDHRRMLAAVDDGLVETLAIAGSKDRVRARIRTFQQLDLLVLVPPAFGLERDEVLANAHNILEAVGA